MKFTKWQVFLISIAVILAGVLVYQLLFVTEKDVKLITKLITILVTYVIAIFKALKHPGVSASGIYEIAYQDDLQDVFRNDKQSYNKLLTAIGYYNQDKYPKALKLLTALENACTSNREHAAVLLFQALCHSDQGETAQAISVYEKLLQYETANFRAWSNLGLQYANAERSMDAENAYRNAIRYNSQHAPAYANLAVLLLSRGDTEQAITEALHAFQLDNKLYQPLSTVAVAYARQGNAEQARKYLNLYAFHGGDKDALAPVVEDILKA